ncbi:MAG: MBOAT family O-acyltransferase [Acutalibacteraceae bacterium]
MSWSFGIYVPNLFDFSAYSDMAIGLGQMLGFKFLENFDYPYISKSITEFWRRWHISLGTWFREYVYIPLGGNRKGLIRQIFNLLIVWFCTGFWHGASWNFLIWGGYYGVLLIIEKLFLLKVLKKIPAFFSHVYTLFLL